MESGLGAHRVPGVTGQPLGGGTVGGGDSRRGGVGVNQGKGIGEKGQVGKWGQTGRREQRTGGNGAGARRAAAGAGGQRAGTGAAGTHDLRVSGHAAAVGGGERGGAGLAVPGHAAVLGGAAHRERVDAVGVAVTVAAVVLAAPVPRGPHKDGAQSPAALWTVCARVTGRWGLGRPGGRVLLLGTGKAGAPSPRALPPHPMRPLLGQVLVLDNRPGLLPKCPDW